MRNSIFAVLTASLPLLLAGCGEDAPEQAAAIADGPGASLLAQIPADSPFVLALTEPFPDAMMDRTWAMLQPSLDDLQLALTRSLQQDQAEADPVMLAVLNELDGKLNRDGFRQLGFAETGQMAAYGLDVIPVLRLPLADPDALRAAIARVETAGGRVLPTVDLDGVSYWRMGEADGAVLAAIVGDAFILTLAPPALETQIASTAFGLTPPTESMANSALPQELASEYGYTSYMWGFIGFEQIADLFLNRRSPIMDWVRAESEMDLDKLGVECRTEGMELAAAMPRLSYGITDLTEMQIDQRGVLELDPEFAPKLAAISVDIPGLGQPQEGLMYAGFGLDLIKAKQLLLEVVNDVTAEPFGCAELTTVQVQAEDLKAQLMQPLPPLVGNVKGFHIALSDLSFSQGQALDVSGVAAMRIDNPMLMFGMAQAMMPELANLQLTPNGEPVALDTQIRVPGAPAIVDPHVAMTDEAVGLSLGSGEQMKLKGFLSADANPDRPLMAIGYRGEFFDRITAMAKANLDPVDDAEALKSLDQTAEMYLKYIDYAQVNMILTDRGIEFRQVARFK